MAPDYLILTESCCELPPERADVPLLAVVPMPLSVGGRNYSHYLDNREISPEAFFDLLRRKEPASTAAPSGLAFTELAEPWLAKGLDVLYVGLSSTLSATYASGIMALRELEGKYPRQRIVSVDSCCGSLGEGLLVEMAIQARRQGKSLEETALLLEQNKLQVVHAFTVDDLHHLRRGGRLPAYAAMLGSVLQFKPIICLNKESVMQAVDRARGMHKAIHALADIVTARVRDFGLQIYIAHGDCPQHAQELEALLRRAGATLVTSRPLGPSIGTHGGPGALAVFFHGTTR